MSLFELQPFTPDEIGKASGLTSQEQEEIIKAVIAAMWADGKLHKSEEAYLDKFRQNFKDDPKILSFIKKHLTARHPILLKPINIPSGLSMKVFQTVLSICSCDLDIDINEIYLIRETAVMLNIDTSKRRKLINDLAKTIKTELLNRLIQNMSQEEIYKLVSITLHVFYNDNELASKQLLYLDELVRLTREHQLIERIDTENDYSMDANKLDEEVCYQFIKFMLEISMSNGIWFPYELKMIREIASQLDVPEEKVEWLIFAVHASYKLLLEV